MPVLPGISQTDMAAVLNDVGYDQNLWVSGLQVLAGYMDLEFSETAAEGDVLLFGEPLITKYDDAALVEHLFDRAKRSIVKRSERSSPVIWAPSGPALLVICIARSSSLPPQCGASSAERVRAGLASARPRLRATPPKR